MTKSEPALRSEDVVILGLSPLSGTPRAPSAEVWGINQLPTRIRDPSHLAMPLVTTPIPTRWFHLHGNNHIDRVCPPGELLRMEELAEQIPVYMLRENQVPGARAFPFDGIRRFVLRVIGCGMGEHDCPVYDNTFPWLIAFAVYMGAKDIYLDGIDYRRSEEAWAVPSISWMLGFAWGHGVRVHVPPGCGLMGNSGNLYGVNGPGCV